MWRRRTNGSSRTVVEAAGMCAVRLSWRRWCTAVSSAMSANNVATICSLVRPASTSARTTVFAQPARRIDLRLRLTRPTPACASRRARTRAQGGATTMFVAQASTVHRTSMSSMLPFRQRPNSRTHRRTESVSSNPRRRRPLPARAVRDRWCRPAVRAAPSSESHPVSGLGHISRVRAGDARSQLFD